MNFEQMAKQGAIIQSTDRTIGQKIVAIDDVLDLVYLQFVTDDYYNPLQVFTKDLLEEAISSGYFSVEIEPKMKLKTRKN